MPRSFVVLIMLALLLAAGIFLLSSQAREVPTRTIEVDVTNGAAS